MVPLTSFKFKSDYFRAFHFLKKFPFDNTTRNGWFSLELRTRDRERKLIKKIEKTLKLIEEDDFGFCNSCGIEIGIRRLEARPTADLCVDCKTLAEIKEKQAGY